MGAEQLEESEFEPICLACETNLQRKRIALFGSYGWGDGNGCAFGEETCQEMVRSFVSESVICNEAPDADAEAPCALGKALT